jgi:hypothetical protein
VFSGSSTIPAMDVVKMEWSKQNEVKAEHCKTERSKTRAQLKGSEAKRTLIALHKAASFSITFHFNCGSWNCDLKSMSY